MHRFISIAFLVVVLGGSLAACSTCEVATGAAAGGAAYEYSNKRSMDDLKEDRDEGRISQEEYDRRKEEIEDRSLVY